jgi:hypothetical protein
MKIHEHYEAFRHWLATLLYGWSCWLARQELRSPWDISAEVEHLKAERGEAERIAKGWKNEYEELWKQRAVSRPPRTVVF